MPIWKRLLPVNLLAKASTAVKSPAIPLRRPGTVALQGCGLIRSFGSGENRTTALNNVSFELLQGEMNLLMGPSGSGKSTLLAVLSALLRPDQGFVHALGTDVWRLSEEQLEKFRLKHCSYIFQGYNLFPCLTARQQLEVVLRWGEGISGAAARKRADHVLGQLGLSKKAHLRPMELSGGEKQRVAIGRALVKDPTFIFADEPTAALDWENGQSVIELLRECARKRGTSVLVVTHDHRLVPFADRVFEMADGKLVVDPVAAETDEYDLDEVTVEMLPGEQGHASGPRLHLQDPTLGSEAIAG